MNTAERKDYQNELFEIARNTKNALFAEWEASASDKKYFKDKHSANKMNKRGLLPEGIGATTVLLLLAAFGKSVFSDEDLEKCNKIIAAVDKHRLGITPRHILVKGIHD